MCFMKPPKTKQPSTPKIPEPVVAPIESSQPVIETGTDRANAERQKKRRQTEGMSLFQIALIPGASNSDSEPGANIT